MGLLRAFGNGDSVGARARAGCAAAGADVGLCVEGCVQLHGRLLGPEILEVHAMPQHVVDAKLLGATRKTGAAVGPAMAVGNGFVVNLIRFKLWVRLIHDRVAIG